MNEEQKKQIDEIKKNVTDYIDTIVPDETGKLTKGFIFIPIENFTTGRPSVLGMCDADLLKLKTALIVKDMANHVLRMKVIQSTPDEAEQKALLAEIK